MNFRSLLLAAAFLATPALTAGPAAAQSPTDHPAPGVTPGRCVDQARPTSGFTRLAARRAARRHVLRGTARDLGCGVDRVLIAVARKHGHRCRLLTDRHRLGHRTSCAKQHWLPVRGTTRWSFRLPKRLPKGMYVIRTRAIDFAGNVQPSRRHRIRLR
jgi:hypothetical protein